MTITIRGPDGSTFRFPDDIPQDEMQSALDAHYGASPDTNAGKDYAESGRASTISAVSGLPIIGAGVNKATAALNAAAQPFIETPGASSASTFSERMAENEKKFAAQTAAYETEHPLASIAGKFAVGSSPFVPLAGVPAAARALGMVGTLPQMIGRGAVSGGLIGGADALARGEDIKSGAETGALFNAGAPVVARGIGMAARGIKNLVHPEVPTPQRTIKVGNVEIPASESNITQDPIAAGQEQIAIRGGVGEPAQRAAQSFDELRTQKLNEARDKIGAGLDTTGANAKVTPQEAGEAVSQELGAIEAKRAQDEAMSGALTDLERGHLRGKLGGENVVAPNAGAAAEVISESIPKAAAKAKAATKEQYDFVKNAPGELDAGSHAGAADRVRVGLSNEQSPVFVDKTTTPLTARALEILDNGDLFRNLAAPAEAGVTAQGGANDTLNKLLKMGVNPERARVAAGVGSGQPTAGARGMTMTEVDQARKQLSSMYVAAKESAARTNNWSDVRGMRRVLKEFDSMTQEALDAGKFSGDAEAVAAAQKKARALHTEYRQDFTREGPGDTLGSTVEKIIGKSDQPMTPDEVVKAAYGTVNEPGGSKAIYMAQHIKHIFGEKSKEWAAYRQGLFSHLLDTPSGSKALEPEVAAERIRNFLNGTKGKPLANAVLSAEERAQLARHADNLDKLVPLDRTGDVNKLIDRFTGRDGGQPSTGREIADYIVGRNDRGDKPISVRLAQRLKNDMTPEGFNSVRQGVWHALTEKPEGVIDFGSQAISQRLHDFLNGRGRALSHVLFTPEERTVMAQFASAHKQMIPVAGSTNPSGTAPMLAKIARKSSGEILRMLGLLHGGIPGYGTMWLAQKGAQKLADRLAVGSTNKLFYGKQPRAPVSTGRLPMILTQGGAPAIENRQRR